MNIHHLELFYYVARHGGISSAVRHMPYGIQQPAVSSQILLLEEDIGAKLFDRRPFRLTPVGEELYAFIRSFFENLASMGRQLQSRAAPAIRIGASEIVLRDYLPPVLDQVRRRQPQMRVVLRSGYQAQLESWLAEGFIDVAVTPLDSRPPARLQCLRLVRLPLVLLTPRKSPVRSPSDLWGRDKIEESLICLPASEQICVRFQKGLRQLGVEWPVSIEVSSMDLVTRYVANGYGIGVNVSLPELVRHPEVRVLPLDGFDPIEVAVLWPGKPTEPVQMLLDEIQRQVQLLWPQNTGATASRARSGSQRGD